MALGWRRCPVCGKERRITRGGKMKQHRRWDETQKKMVTCQGSGLMPDISRRYPPGKG